MIFRSMCGLMLAVALASISLPAQAGAPPGYLAAVEAGRLEIASAPATVTLTPRRLQQLTAVNLGLNKTLRYQADSDEFWQRAVAAGDCEDIAIAKRVALQDLGWPLGALRLVASRNHTVLGVFTDQGVLILDWGWPPVPLKHFQDRGFRSIYSEQPGDPENWTMLMSGMGLTDFLE